MKTIRCLIYLFLLLTITSANAQVCELPALPIEQRIQNRTFPSVFSAWDGSRVQNRPQLSKTEKLALHNLHWHAPYFKIQFSETNELTPTGKLETSLALRDELLTLSPNMLFIVEIRVRDEFPDVQPEDWPYWLRDAAGNRVLTPSGKKFLTDFTLPGMQDFIVQRAVAVAKCGLFDGLFFDWFAEAGHTVLLGYYSYEEEQQAKDTILQRIRAEVRDDFLIIINTGRFRIPRRAWGINGTFMEVLRDTDSGYTLKRLKEIESTLLWSEKNLRSPQITCLAGFSNPTEPPDSPNNLRFMRIFTTMSLTHSDGYVVHRTDMSAQYIWHAFWEADLGRPVGPTAQRYGDIEGLFIREFTNGWAVYNRSGETQAITLPRVSTGVSSNKQDTTHHLPDLDSEIYLKVRNPADVNGDWIINILDLLQVANGFGTSTPDVNGDGVVNILDLTLVGQQFSQ